MSSQLHNKSQQFAPAAPDTYFVRAAVLERYTVEVSLTKILKEANRMTYDVIALACEQLSYRDKLRLAQLLIQT